MYKIEDLRFYFELPQRADVSRESLVMLEIEGWLKEAIINGIGVPAIGAVIAELRGEDVDSGEFSFDLSTENQPAMEQILEWYGMDKTTIEEVMVSVCEAAELHPHVMVL